VVAQSASSSSFLRGHEDGPKQRKLLDPIDGMEQPLPTHLVTLKQCEESEFNNLIWGLGGSILFYHPDTSIAVVQGLSDTAVADAVASDCVETVDEDENLPFGDPEMDLDGLEVESEDFPDAQVHSPGNPAAASRYSPSRQTKPGPQEDLVPRRSLWLSWTLESTMSISI